MAANRKRHTSSSRCGEYNKVRAKTIRMKLGVRFAFCCFILTASVAFLATTLKPYKELGELQDYYKEEVLAQESGILENVDQKAREYQAIETDPNYLGIIARDRLNYYEPGEHIFRIER